MRTLIIILITLPLVGSGQSEHSIEQILNKPFDLYEFKKAKGQSNSGGADVRSYYFKPDSSGIYYRFLFFPPMSGFIYKGDYEAPYTMKSERGIFITTYKPAGNQQLQYLDPNETLIEYMAFFNDSLIPNLALVGLKDTIIKESFGRANYEFEDALIYERRGRALVLHMASHRVDWVRYLRLNTNNLDLNLAKRISKDPYQR